MKTSFAGIIVLLATAGLMAGTRGAEAGAKEFHAVIDGSQAHPPNPSSARGIGHFTLNAEQTELAYSIEFESWVSNEIFSHIHVDAAGNNGQDAMLHDLPNGNPKKGVFVLEEPFMLTALLNGFLYVNVHTLTYRQGEIAGYLLPGTPAARATWGRIKASFR
jgi:hypothetical protein